ncbi:MAG: Demethylrebeccamycin-D-glucose O-methyltransferase [Parcubacteria group bacterium ADurb.Bin159]|nr:MAG: Demethylrebeccamycin-D-glucose O-methyltransferase [Parcubacteria group bacterium ADurb.Bin159]
MRQEIAIKILKENIKNFDTIAEEFSVSRSQLWPDFRKFNKFIKSNDKILDIGCGNGRLYSIFRKENIQYFGIDTSSKMINLAKNKWPNESNNPIFTNGNILDIPFSSNFFDIVFSLAVLHHIPSLSLREKAIKECARVLKPQGFLVISVWNLFSFKFLLKYHNLLMLLGKRERGLDYGDTFIPWKAKNDVIWRYYHAFSKNELKKLLKKDFEIIENKSNIFKANNLVIIAKKRK